MTGIGIVLVAAGLSLLMTLVALQGCGVNRRNHGLFVKVMRLKARRAAPSDIGKAVLEHVQAEMKRRPSREGKYDIAPVYGLLDTATFDEAMGVVICALLDSGIHPVSLDLRDGASLIVG